MDAAKVAHDADHTRAVSRRQMLTEMRERGMIDQTLDALDRLVRQPDLYETPKSHAGRLRNWAFRTNDCCS